MLIRGTYTLSKPRIQRKPRGTRRRRRLGTARFRGFLNHAKQPFPFCFIYYSICSLIPLLLVAGICTVRLGTGRQTGRQRDDRLLTKHLLKAEACVWTGQWRPSSTSTMLKKTNTRPCRESNVLYGGRVQSAGLQALSKGPQIPKRRQKNLVSRGSLPLNATNETFSDNSIFNHVEQLSTVEEYNKRMAERMGWHQLENPFEYRPERGLYYHYITEDMVVGSQPRSRKDIDHLSVSEGIRAILNLQQDRDLHHWGVNIEDLRCAARNQSIELIRTPAVDFDPHSLRATLPSAVAALERARMELGRVYVHCTAGLGRSPAVAIASLYWFHGMSLDDAYAHVTGIRPCGPNKEAIRGATYDLLSNGHWDGFHQIPMHAWTNLDEAQRKQIQEKLGF